MDWLLEHIEMVLPVALVLLYLFQRMFVPEEGEGGPPPTETDEEARRIQEEIRRKIIARQRGEEPPPPPPEEVEQPQRRPATFPRREEAPPPLKPEKPPRAPHSFPGGERRIVKPKPAPVQTAGGGRNYLDELQAQRERLRQAQQAKEEALQRTAATPAGRAQRATVRRRPTAALRDQLQDDLATADNLKRAFLLKEIVDRPIGLRDRADVFTNWG